MMRNIKVFLGVISVASSNVITIRQGSLRGLRFDGYISFQGIPYAFLGDSEHFKAASGPAPSWSGIREPRRSYCMASSPPSECLLLDVSVPYGSLEPLPVFVWVKGDAAIYHPGLIVKQGIIVVVVSHRLGLEGFLCSDDERIQGNVGVKDVVLALQWVRENIMEFSGNPSKVVVGGQSFGAAMVEALTLSSMTDNLYSGVILQSGSILSPWAFQYDANERATILGRWYNGTDPISNLINASLNNLLIEAEQIKYPYSTFGICVESESKKGNRFLTDSPINLLSHGKTHDVPMMVGYNTNRDYIFQTILQTVRAIKRISLSMPFLLPDELNFSSLDDSHILVQMQKIYFENNITMEALLEYLRDAYFLNHIHRSVRLHAAASALPIYYYQLSYPEKKIADTEIIERNTSVAHYGEAYYLFPANDKEYIGLDSKVQKDLLMLWGNFIKYLEPTPKLCPMKSWRPVDRHEPRLFDINVNLTMVGFPYSQQMEFWDAVYARYYYDKHTK